MPHLIHDLTADEINRVLKNIQADITSKTNAKSTVQVVSSVGSVSSGGSSSGGGSVTATGDAIGTQSGATLPLEVVGILNNALPALSTGYLEWNGSAWVFGPGGSSGGFGGFNCGDSTAATAATAVINCGASA